MGLRLREKAPKALAMFDAQLADNEYLAGDKFSIADITLGVALDVRQVKVVEIPDLPNIDLHAQVSARPSFSAT